MPGAPSSALEAPVSPPGSRRPWWRTQIAFDSQMCYRFRLAGGAIWEISDEGSIASSTSDARPANFKRERDIAVFWLHSGSLEKGRRENQMNQNQLKCLCGGLAALALLGSAMTCAGAYAQENTAGSEDSAVQQEAAALASAGTRNEITFTSWTGPYMRSQMLGFVRPYEGNL